MNLYKFLQNAVIGEVYFLEYFKHYKNNIYWELIKINKTEFVYILLNNIEKDYKIDKIETTKMINDFKIIGIKEDLFNQDLERLLND